MHSLSGTWTPGLYLKGVLHVDKHRPDTATVHIRDAAESKGGSGGSRGSDTVLIVGTGDRNRAVHGDVVAVEVSACVCVCVRVRACACACACACVRMFACTRVLQLVTC